MTLVDDLRRPATRRIAHTVTVLSALVWAPLALIAVVLGLLSVFADWLLEKTLQGFDKVKWAAFEAYVKRWPAVAPSGICTICTEPIARDATTSPTPARLINGVSERSAHYACMQNPADPLNLQDVIDKARERVMSPQEVAEQRANWANQLHD